MYWDSSETETPFPASPSYGETLTLPKVDQEKKYLRLKNVLPHGTGKSECQSY